MAYVLDSGEVFDVKPHMDMSEIWLYNLEKAAFKSMFVNVLNDSIVKEILKALNADSLSDTAVFVPPWKSPLQRGAKYDLLFNELRCGRGIRDILVSGSRIVVCKYFNTTYIMLFTPAAAVNPDFIMFKKGEQPSA